MKIAFRMTPSQPSGNNLQDDTHTSLYARNPSSAFSFGINPTHLVKRVPSDMRQRSFAPSALPPLAFRQFNYVLFGGHRMGRFRIPDFRAISAGGGTAGRALVPWPAAPGTVARHSNCNEKKPHLSRYCSNRVQSICKCTCLTMTG